MENFETRVAIGFVAECTKCGADVTYQVKVSEAENGVRLNISPCDQCIDIAVVKADTEAYQKGLSDARR